jgi:predicted outer membrane lipoprotein
MRSIAFAPAFLIIGSFALAHPPKVDLDQPGVLNALKLEHPQRYQAQG